MTIKDFLSVEQNDFDTYDEVYDAGITVCAYDKIKDDYDRFADTLFGKVEVVCKTGACSLVAAWSDLIKRNFAKFKEFTKLNWKENCQYEYDEDEFTYQWLKEIENYLAGNVSNSFYSELAEFAERLE